MPLTHFIILCKEKKEPGLYLQQAENILALNPQLFCQQTDKKISFGKMSCYIRFFIGVVGIKIALKTLKILISIALWIKLITDQLLLLFLCNFCSFFIRRRSPSNQSFLLLLMICFSYAANYNTRGAFVIIFLTSSDLLNHLRSVGTIVVTTEVAETASKSFSLRNSSLKE